MDKILAQIGESWLDQFDASNRMHDKLAEAKDMQREIDHATSDEFVSVLDRSVSSIKAGTMRMADANDQLAIAIEEATK